MNKTLLIVLGVVVVLVVAGGLWWYVASNHTDQTESAQSTTKSQSQTEPTAEAETSTSKEVPLLIKSLPIALAKYDASTGMAGDMKFTKSKLQFDLMYMDYGFTVPKSSAGPAKNNPQPTFIAPLGTKVRSILNGVVVNIPELYSKDFSIMVAKDTSSQTMYEMEHVINPIVKVGDKVTAGQIVAEVSDYDKNVAGFGLVEMGILVGGNPPKHVCPFVYLDSSAKDKITSDLKQLYIDWNTFKGKTIYDVSAYKTNIGCLVDDAING